MGCVCTVMERFVQDMVAMRHDNGDGQGGSCMRPSATDGTSLDYRIRGGLIDVQGGYGGGEGQGRGFTGAAGAWAGAEISGARAGEAEA